MQVGSDVLLQLMADVHAPCFAHPYEEHQNDGKEEKTM